MSEPHDFDLLNRLCSAPGVAGHEWAVADCLRAALGDAGIESRLDRVGNLVARLPGEGPHILLFAHMDEVGLLVRKIHPQGYILVERIGGTSPHVLPGKRLLVWGSSGVISGVVGAVPMHLLADHSQPVQLNELYIDIGAQSAQEAARLGVEVGQVITYAPGFERLQNRIAAKSLDDRLGCFMLVELARKLAAGKVPCNLSLAFVVQEEITLGSAMPLIHALQPDYAIGLDATLAFDSPDLPDSQTDISLGAGTVIKIMDRIRGSGVGFVAHAGLRAQLEHLAAEHAIPFQREVVTGLSTAATLMPFGGSGLPVAAISFPLRYSHSPYEVADLSDIQATAALVEAVVRQPWQGGA